MSTALATRANIFDRQGVRVLAVTADVSALWVVAAGVIRSDAWLILALVCLVVAGAALLLLLARSSYRFRRAVLLGSLAVFAFACWRVVDPTHRQTVVSITEPSIGASVGPRAVVKGRVDDPNATVYVVVRSFDTAGFWNQELPLVDGAGNWAVNAHFGDEQTRAGAGFEVIALASSENFLMTRILNVELPVGQISRIPQALSRSGAIHVTLGKVAE